MSTPTQTQLKERALFYLSRHVRELEDKVNIDHENLAKDRTPYYIRQKMEEQSSELANEYEAMNWLHDFVNEAKVRDRSPEDEELVNALTGLLKSARDTDPDSDEVKAFVREHRHIPDFKELGAALLYLFEEELREVS
jgi:hypothetical protein